MNKSPHIWWTIILMGLIIIGLVTFIISKQVLCSQALMEYVSIFSLFLSIILSLLAIQYTYSSNSEIHQQFKDINAAANNIKDTSEKLTIASNKLNENLDKILDRLEDINQGQINLSEQLNDDKVSTDIKNTPSSNQQG